MLSRKDKLRLIRCVRGYENPTGGFNFPRETPASISETYNGVMLFHEMGIRYSSSLTRQYVKKIELRSDLPLEHLYRLAKVAEVLRIPEKLSDVKESVMGRKFRKSTKLTDAYYSVLIEDTLGVRGILTPDLLGHVRTRNVRRLKYMSECQKYLAVMTHLNIEFDRDDAIAWIQDTQGFDGGFGFLPGSTSFLENVYGALDSLRMLRSSPLNIQACEDFILSCRDKDGAFGRQIMARSSLEDSLLAVRSLKIIDAMRRGTY